MHWIYHAELNLQLAFSLHPVGSFYKFRGTGAAYINNFFMHFTKDLCTLLRIMDDRSRGYNHQH